MSFKGSEKEFILSLSLQQNKGILEKELGFTLENMQLEKHYPGMKIDMYGFDNTGNEVFVENVLLKSNTTHQKKVLKIINMIEKGSVVYLAYDFQEHHIKELQQTILKSGKSINLYLIKLNPNILNPLEMLNRMHKLKIYENLHLLNITNPIQFLEKDSIVKPIQGTKIERKEKRYNFESRKDANEYLLETLRKRIPYFLPFHRQKANLDSIRVISFGAGRSDCNYFVSLSDRRNMAFVELRFSENTSKIYNAIKEKEVLVKERIGEKVVFKDNSILVEFKPLKSVEDTVEELVDIFEKMIIAFSNYTYYFYEEHMWQYHSQGI